MQTPLTRRRTPFLAWLWVLAFTLLTAACGGGGGGASSSTNGGGGGVAATGTVVLTGVAANGAPLTGATVSVVDANGVSQGSTQTHIANGTYTLTLSTTTAKFPLLVQAVGVDMSGNPAVLHTVVNGTGAGTRTAHITPLTNAVVAMLLGGDPRAHFQAAASQSAATRSANWALLGNTSAVTAATNFLLTAINANLTAAKPTALNKATVNIFSDPAFAADKTGLDAVIDGVNVQLGQDGSGNELLMLSNRLLLTGASEVIVKLATARSELSGATPTVTNANAVVSATKTTTTSVAITRVASLINLQTTINDQLAKLGSLTAASFNPNGLARPPIISAAYTYFNGTDPGQLIDQLVAYGQSGYQLGAFQVLNCLDDPVPGSGCTKVRVASLLRHYLSGQVVGVFENAVTWSSTAGWTFVGNDTIPSMYLYPLTWQEWDAYGTAVGSAKLGLQLDMSSNWTLLGAATLGLPNPNSTARPLYYPVSGLGALRLSAVETGDLIADQVLAVDVSGPLSASDVSFGARYRVTSSALAPFPTVAVPAGEFILDKVSSTRLTGDLPSNLAASAYPLPDGITTTPLSITDFVAGLNLSWHTWAAANPNLRMAEVRAVITSTASAPVKQTVILPPLSARQTTVPAFTGSVPVDAIQYTLWLIAQDEQGRRYISKIVAQ